MLRWLSSDILSIRRLAFGAALLSPVPTLKAGHELVSVMVPSLQFQPGDDIADLVFQVNRPRPSSALADLRVNRLANWSVTEIQMLSLEVGGGSLRISGDEMRGLAVRLQLDINSDAKRTTAIPAKVLPTLFEELTGLGNEVAVHGDHS
jgi:hypothetical protein